MINAEGENKDCIPLNVFYLTHNVNCWRKKKRINHYLINSSHFTKAGDLFHYHPFGSRVIQGTELICG